MTFVDFASFQDMTDDQIRDLAERVLQEVSDLPSGELFIPPDAKVIRAKSDGSPATIEAGVDIYLHDWSPNAPI